MSKEATAVRDLVEKCLTPQIFQPAKNQGDPWLDGLPEKDKAALRLGRSGPINLGNAREALYRELSRLRYGDDAVPQFIKGSTVSAADFDNFLHSQRQVKVDGPQQIVTNIEVDEGSLLNYIKAVKKSKTPICQKDLAEIMKRFANSVDHLIVRPVDAAILIEGMWNFHELKSTADTDTGKTSSVVTKDLLGPWLSYGDQEAKVFYGVFYNNSKPGNDRWSNGKHAFLKYLNRSFVLVDEELWEVVLPESVSYAKFNKLCQSRINYLWENR